MLQMDGPTGEKGEGNSTPVQKEYPLPMLSNK